MTTRNMNPPIPGHQLLHEGMQYPRLASHQDFERDEAGHLVMYGGCECGAKPDGWPAVGVNATKRWHRQHKAEIRARAAQATMER